MDKELKESWSKTYCSPIFGNYELKFKIYEKNCKFLIEIENSFTDNICYIENNFSSYGDVLDWIRYIEDDLIPLNNQCLSEKLQQRLFICK